jgi:hypothetical protein
MLRIQSILCAFLFILNFTWHSGNPVTAVGLNLLLVASCTTLLLTSGSSRLEHRHDARKDRSDHQRNIIVASLVVTYLAASLLKLNGSSTALWQEFADREPPSRGLLAGTAKMIRMDEWLVQTPWIWSQTNQNPPFPTTNRSVGNGASPLLVNLPVRHWTMMFRPQMGAFFLFDRERAFAFNWNFKWFGMLLGGFLFLRIIARGDNFLALSGAAILLFAGYVQWFFSSPTCMPEIVAMFFFGLWAVHLLAQAKSRWRIVAAGVVLLFTIEQFVFCCYPRFQIPLLYLALALMVSGAIHLRRSSRMQSESNLFRISVSIAILITAALLIGIWSHEVWPTIREIESQVYPGQTISTGGSFAWYFFLAPFLEFSVTENHFPHPFANVCAASGFVFLTPFLIAAFVREISQRRLDAILLAIISFLILTIFFMLHGVPLWLARATGWSLVTSDRAVLAVGVASIVGLVRYLGWRADERSFNTRTSLLVVALGIGLVLFGILKFANVRLGDFAKFDELTAVAIFFATVFALLWQRARIAACMMLLIPCLYSYGLVNPINRGVPGITKSAMFRWLSKVERSDPDALWIVTGRLTNRTCFLAQLVKATGATTLGGTRSMPNHEMLKVLDPENRSASVHNRYARICFQTSADPRPVFELYAPDYYLVRLPFEGELFKRLGVKYVVVVDEDERTAELPGFERVGNQAGCVLFRSVDEISTLPPSS